MAGFASNPNTGGLFSNPSAGNPGGLFSNPNPGNPGGLFSNQNTGTFGGLLPNANSGAPGGLFSNPNPGNTGGLFSNPNPGNAGGGFSNPNAPSGNTNSLFPNPNPNTGTPGGMFSNPNASTPNAGGLFSNPGNTGGLFTNPNAPTSNTGGLFSNPNPNPGSNPGGLFSNPNSSTGNPGGLFSNTNPSGNTGGLFSGGNNPPGNTGGLFSNSNTSGGLFSSGNTGNLLAQPSNNPGGLFSQPQNPLTFTPTNSGLFSSANTGGMFSQMAPGGTTQNTRPTQLGYSSEASPMFKLIGSISEQEQSAFYNLRASLDNHDKSLTQAESLMVGIEKCKAEVKGKLLELFTFSRKAQTAEKRCRISLGVLKKFENNISGFVKDAVKLYNQCEYADSYHQINSPGGFLSEMLGCCEERLKAIEDNFKEIQELVAIEGDFSQFPMVVSTIMMMQEKFQLVSSVAFDMHTKVAQIIDRYSRNTDIAKSLTASSKGTKIEKLDQPKNYSSIRDIIAGKTPYSGNYY